MTATSLQAEIDALSDDSKWYGGWYQPIVFPDGSRTHSTKMSDEEFYGRESLGLNKWEKIIKPNLPCSLVASLFLEIGCNAGLYCAEALRSGANSVIGVESHDHFFRQAELLVSAFGQLGGGCIYHREAREFIRDVVWATELRLLSDPCDIVLLANSLYWVCYSDEHGFIPHHEREMAQFIENLSRITRYVLIIGSETNKHAFGATLADVVPRLEPHFSIITAKPHNCDRKLNVISARSKNL